jgi:hypothetical protein
VVVLILAVAALLAHLLSAISARAAPRRVGGRGKLEKLLPLDQRLSRTAGVGPISLGAIVLTRAT